MILIILQLLFYLIVLAAIILVQLAMELQLKIAQDQFALSLAIELTCQTVRVNNTYI